MIVCFDVRSEKFRFIDGWYIHQLINYKGKLGGINLHYEQRSEWGSGWDTRELQLRVLEDVEKQDWSKYVYPFLENGYRKHLSVVGMTMTSEIVLSENWGSRPYNVFYFNPERNTFQCVNFQGVGAKHEKFNHCGIVYAFVDHVDHLSVSDANQLKSSIYAQDRCMFESINKFDALCRLDDG
ncbi:F-box associated domain type 3 [Arabidopsis suecica]|uniref:F-box associated domain type 3 n=1 Tax=Arabidopsis suecica TaxID=45249 RepID=A0A8T1ZH31_ARASU|nr:F-box associated domain type 3 [Arabidopsis suecica]